MKKLSILLVVSFIMSSVAVGQQLVVKRSDKGLFLEHIVKAKENFYSIGRLYNVHPRELASFNSLELSGGLSIGQTLQVPLGNENFSQSGGNSGTPVYYVVGEKEGLYRVSVNNNKVEIDNLRRWNRLSSDNISVGEKLIVGFLTGAEAGNSAPAGSAVATVETPKEEPKKVPENKEKEITKDADPEPEPARPVNNSQSNPVKPVQTQNNSTGGFFQAHFMQQTATDPVSHDATVTSGIFKTASGWQDKKYYMLIDDVEPGTIVRIINPVNNTEVYAKVLGGMSGIRQNQGLDIRISNAAASALGIQDTEKFIVKVQF